MQLSKLLYHIYDSTLYNDPEITGLALDSRAVQPGYLFFAYKGTSLDGRDFIDDAIQKGAAAILSEVGNESISVHTKNNVPIFPVKNINQYIGRIAETFYDFPSKKLKIVGVTGTNGKTSCTYFIAQALQNINLTCGVIGTLGNGLFGDIKPGTLTTPDAITLHALFADFVKQHAAYVAMEASSHSIEQGRVNGIEFAVGVFTNLTQDHLDYHGTMEAYGAAKKKLFDNPLTKYAVINADDSFGKELIETAVHKNIFAYTLDKNLVLPKSVAKIAADKISLNLTGIDAHVYTPWGEGKLEVPLIGKFNLHNILAALTSLCLLDIPFDQALKALSQVTPVPGRMQTFGGKSQPLVVVDYAHTPDALEKALIALKAHCEGKLHCLFGCGGDRDKGKRPLMAKIAEQYADHVMVTDDNPRTENPEQIVDDIMAGFSEAKKIKVQHDRSKAIQDIIQYAQTRDCVLIAGKGAETYQQIGKEKIPFSDVEKVQEFLHSNGKKSV